MEPGELGELIQEKKLLVLFLENGACSWNEERTERKVSEWFLALAQPLG